MEAPVFLVAFNGALDPSKFLDWIRRLTVKFNASVMEYAHTDFGVLHYGEKL